MNALFEAYRNARYEVFGADGIIVLKHGEASPALDALLGPHAREWAFVTAWNPASRKLSREENKLRHRELLKEVWPHYQTLPGSGGGEGWESEESLFIVGISRGKAIELGRRFGQLAILVGSVGECAQVVACEGE